MSKVIQLFDKKEEQKELTEVACYCISCREEWQATLPLGTIELECPKCHSMKGRIKFKFLRKEAHWHCNCGNNYFSITKECIYCPNCGLKHRF